MPTEYKGFASQPFTLQDGGAFSKDFALGAVTSRSVSGDDHHCPQLHASLRTPST